MWYGVSSIFARFLTLLLTPYLTHQFRGTPEFGEMSLVYSLTPFLYTLAMFGFETAYFRYIQKKEHEKDVYNTILSSLTISTVLLTIVTVYFNQQIASLIGVGKHPEYITICAFIVACDTISTIPFAKLRHEGRPKKYAFIRVGGILLNILITFFFLSVFPALQKNHPNGILSLLYSANFGVGYVLVATLVQGVFQVAILSKELLKFKWQHQTVITFGKMSMIVIRSR